MNYSSKRRFKIWAYTVSHCSLLLRSPLKYPDEDGYSETTNHNVDIEFWGVDYMDIPTSFEEIIITKTSKNEFLKNRQQPIDEKTSMVFEIKTNQKKYYIVAAGCLIGKNKWEQEDRILNFDSDLEHDEIITFFKL